MTDVRAQAFNYIVDISAKDGTPVFKGTVSQVGDFVHLERYPHGSVATLRVHDMLAASTVEGPNKILAERMKDELRTERKNG